MKQKRTPPSLASAARWVTTMTLLIVLALKVVCLAQPLAMAASLSPAAAPDFEAIDKFVKAEMEAQRIPGLALGIVQGDQMWWC